MYFINPDRSVIVSLPGETCELKPHHSPKNMADVNSFYQMFTYISDLAASKNVWVKSGGADMLSSDWLSVDS
jgi:hypothetical protein